MNDFQKSVIERLSRHTRVWIVGGAVRDHILGLESPDMDLVCVLSPKEVKDILCEQGFSAQVIGRHFSTVSIFTEGSKADVVQAEELEKDAQRRDFTINAIYQDPVSGEFYDPMEGRKDLEAKILKACGKPDERFREDPVRILRMVKFAVKFSMKIDPNTWEHAVDHLSFLSTTSRERITAELAGILVLTEAEKAVRMLDKIGYWDMYLPELARLKGLEQNQYHSLDVWEHTMAVFRNTPEDLYLRLAGLFHDSGKWEVASRECHVSGTLKFADQNYSLEGFKIVGTRGPRELEYKLKSFIGKKIRILGARLDQYPEIVQFKKVIDGEPTNFGLVYVENGKRHFLMHEAASARLLADVLKRYTFSMFFDGVGKKQEQNLIKLVENHMQATLVFMPEFRGEFAKRSFKNRAAELVWKVCWDGRNFELKNIHDFLILWKADYQAGKLHTTAQNNIFERIFAELIAVALWQKENLVQIDWKLFRQYAMQQGLSGSNLGIFKELVREKAMKEMKQELNHTFLKKVYWEFKNM